MIKYLIFFTLVFSFPAISFARKSERKQPVAYTARDATIAMDAFNEYFFNKDMKLYSTTSDGKGRAAIWTQAIYWDMVMNAYKRTGDQKYRRLIEDIYRGGYEQYDGYNWDNTVEWFIYDDIMWWVISMARAYEVTGDLKYLGHSILGFDRVWYGTPGVDDEGSYDKANGGLYWGWKKTERGKMACINYPTVVAAVTLYNITKDESYLAKAKEIYGWSRKTLFDATEGKVADHKVGNNPTNWTTQVYNQATCIGAGILLYKVTDEKKYLADAILATDYVKNTMSDKNGILPFKNGIEQGIYTAIFAQYVTMLINDCNQPQYSDWLRFNINTAWANRDRKRNLTFKDALIPCPEGILEVYDASGCVALMQVIQLKQ